jgi:hypothetical protein
MVESRLATPRPNHRWSNRVGALKDKGRVRSLSTKSKCSSLAAGIWLARHPGANFLRVVAVLGGDA